MEEGNGHRPLSSGARNECIVGGDCNFEYERKTSRVKRERMILMYATNLGGDVIKR